MEDPGIASSSGFFTANTHDTSILMSGYRLDEHGSILGVILHCGLINTMNSFGVCQCQWSTRLGIGGKAPPVMLISKANICKMQNAKCGQEHLGDLSQRISFNKTETNDGLDSSS